MKELRSPDHIVTGSIYNYRDQGAYHIIPDICFKGEFNHHEGCQNGEHEEDEHMEGDEHAEDEHMDEEGEQMEGMEGDEHMEEGEHAHSGFMVTVPAAKDTYTMSFTVTEDMLGEWEIGCFLLDGVHYDSGMVGTLNVTN